MHELAVGILHAPLNLIFIAWISLEVIRITSYENKRAIEVENKDPFLTTS